MTPQASRTLGNVLVGLVVVLLIVLLGGMLGVFPKVISSREVFPAAFVLVLVARVLRRRGAPAAT